MITKEFYCGSNGRYHLIPGVDIFVLAKGLPYILDRVFDDLDIIWSDYPGGSCQYYFDRVVKDWTVPSDRPRCEWSECPNHNKVKDFKSVAKGYGGNDWFNNQKHYFCSNYCSAKYRESHYLEYPKYKAVVESGGGWGLQHSNPTKYKSTYIWKTSDNAKHNYDRFIQGYGISKVYVFKSLDISIRCRSLLEYDHLQLLDTDPNLKSIEYESISINYSFDGYDDWTYIPDLLINYKDGLVKLVEIKPESLVNDPVNLAKFEAARKYCKDKGWTFEVWTENDF